jgi:hypothetical protein
MPTAPKHTLPTRFGPFRHLAGQLREGNEHTSLEQHHADNQLDDQQPGVCEP